MCIQNLFSMHMSKHEAKKLKINSNLINKIGILWMVMIEKYYDDGDNENEIENENENENENEIMN